MGQKVKVIKTIPGGGEGTIVYRGSDWIAFSDYADIISEGDTVERQAEKLAQMYCAKGIVPSDFETDALHIAIATIWKADALVSYNFGPIVNLATMVAVNEVNRSRNLQEIFLCQPQEVIISGG